MPKINRLLYSVADFAHAGRAALSVLKEQSRQACRVVRARTVCNISSVSIAECNEKSRRRRTT